MMCPDCLGTGHERPYEPWEDCATCDGSGQVDGGWEDDDPDCGSCSCTVGCERRA